MKPKFRRVPALAALVVVLAAGLASGARGGDDSAIQKIMDQVQTRSRAIGKGLRSATALDRKAMAADAASLIRLGKEARMLTEPAKERRKSQQEWTRAVDDFLRASDDFARVIAALGSSQPQATQSYQKLQKTCVTCHSAFRGESG
jgi:cytochrome c556